MKIIEENQNLIILKNNNISNFIISILLLLIGFLGIFSDFSPIQIPRGTGLISLFLGFFIGFFTKVKTFTFNKSTNQFLVLKLGLRGKKTQTYDLSQIKEIKLSTRYAPKKSKKYRLMVLLSNDKTIRLSSSRSKTISDNMPIKLLGEKLANFLKVPFNESSDSTN